jgi:hypothetical protein
MSLAPAAAGRPLTVAELDRIDLADLTRGLRR